MKVVMTKAELAKLVASHPEDEASRDSLICPDPKAPSGWAVYVMMNHWDKLIPIEVQG